jgi:hypothetical protein
MRLILLSLAVWVAAAAQPVNESYSARIREYTTEPHFSTELIATLPGSTSAPSPDKVTGYVIGTPEKLSHSTTIHRYIRELARTSPRVRVFPIGKSEEGREMLLAAISDEENIRRLDELKGMTARLADPRGLPDADGRALAARALPFYWACGGLHSGESGPPEMLMELAYRLAVEESPIARNIRRNSVVLLTPVVDPDGRDKYVDLYNWTKANPQRLAPPLVYWGKYVAHDNNRDGIGLALALSRAMLRTFLEYHPQVQHDLHESVPFLYISTGTGPYNAWLDPITVNEWQQLAWHEVEGMTKRGVPGVWTHGFYDGWGANYMLATAHSHNAIGRFYETFSVGGADTAERSVPPPAATRAWYRPNPPFEKVRWSIRNNINLQQSALLLGMDYVATNRRTVMENFYLKSRRAVEKALKEGPAAWILPAEERRPLAAAELVNLLREHGVETHRTEKTFETGKTTFGAGSYVVRMDQPYSRLADMLLDTQYYSVDDPRPYDDTGWTAGALRNVKTVRVTDAAILRAPMTKVSALLKPAGGVSGSGPAYVIPHHAENPLATFRFRLRDIRMLAAEEAFDAGAAKYAPGAVLIPSEGNPADLRQRLAAAAEPAGLKVASLRELPEVAAHELRAPRIALVHSWISTQNEGWLRIAFDTLEIPYTYLAGTRLRETPDLRSKFDVIIYGPTPGSAQRLVRGIPKNGPDPIPWLAGELTPNFGTSPDQAPDIRGGLGLDGLAHLQRFVEEGGLLVTIGGNASLPVDFGLIEGVTIVPARELQARGSVLRVVVADKTSPVTYGYDETLAVHFNQAPILAVNPYVVAPRDQGQRRRPSGRGGPEDPDIPQGRPWIPPERPAKKEPPAYLDELSPSAKAYVPPPGQRARVLLEFAGEKDLLVSGMLAGGRELAGKAALVNVPLGKGNVLLFANNPMWRHITQGSYFLLFNAMMNYDSLRPGRSSAARTLRTRTDLAEMLEGVNAAGVAVAP